MIMRFLLSIGILYGTASFASPLNEELECLNVETRKTEFWALNCIMVAQKNKVIINDCYNADRAVRSIDKQLMKLVDTLTLDPEAEGPEFYTAIKKIKHYRSRLRKVDNNLSLAKKISGNYNWSNTIYPSYYLYKDK